MEVFNMIHRASRENETREARREDIRARLANFRKRQAMKRKANDIYDMEGTRMQPAIDKYTKGDPSAWGEDVNHDDLWRGDTRNEMNIPNLKGDAPVAPAPGPMPMAPEGEGEEAPVMARREHIANQVRVAAARRKAARCCKLATAMLGKTASTEMVEDQALAFMAMSDRDIFASLSRIRKASEVKVADEVEEEKKEVEAPAPAPAAEAAPAPAPAPVAPAILAPVAPAAIVDEAAAEGESVEQEMAEQADADAELSDESMEGLGEDLLGEAASDMDMLDDIELNSMPVMEEETILPQGNDTVLQALYDMESGQVLASKPKKVAKTVQKLGGAVKVASQNKDVVSDLSKLWASDPDVSDSFKS
jgi:hypothetical protein